MMNSRHRLHPVTLRFLNPEAERAFWEQQSPTMTFFARMGCLLASFMYLSFGILDIWIVPEHMEAVFVIRLVVVTCILAVFAFTFTDAFRRHNQFSQLLAASFGAMGLVLMTAIIPLEAGYLYYVGIGIAIVFMHILIGLRFLNALILNLALLFAYEMVVIFRDLPLHMIINNNYVLIGFSVVSATGGYIIERQRRQVYCQTEEMKRLKDRADNANQAKSRFLAGMSHELRTPLNAIIGYTELLSEDARETGNNGLLADLAAIHGAGKHLMRLINNVLDLAKIEAGKLELSPYRLSMSELLERIRFTATPLADNNDNELVITTHGTPQTLYIDGLRLEQILLNLIGNACKFTRLGKIELAVSIDGDRICFRVTDTGIGMNKKQLQSVFEEYHQAEASTTRDYGGTGLGLAITRHLVQMMGGQITADSEPGRGTTLVVSLPCIGGRGEAVYQDASG